MKKITKSPLFTPLLITGIDVLAWIIFIIFNVCYEHSIDWVGYEEALKVDPDVLINVFYNDASLILLFIGFLFMAIGIAFSIYMMVEWIKFAFNKVRKENPHE